MTRDDDLPCQELVERVTDHLEGALEPDLQARLEQHLEECEGCVEHVDQVRRTIALLGALPEEDGLSTDARSRLLVAFRAWREDQPGAG